MHDILNMEIFIRLSIYSLVNSFILRLNKFLNLLREIIELIFKKLKVVCFLCYILKVDIYTKNFFINLI